MVRWIIKGIPISKPIPKENHLLGHNVNHQGKAEKGIMSKHISCNLEKSKIQHNQMA
jgi:hypothetical protein